MIKNIKFTNRYTNCFLRNLDSNGNFNITEFFLEKDYVNESIRPFEDHLVLKDYYKEFSNQTCLINFKLVVSLIENIMDSQKNGKSSKQLIIAIKNLFLLTLFTLNVQFCP